MNVMEPAGNIPSEVEIAHYPSAAMEIERYVNEIDWIQSTTPSLVLPSSESREEPGPEALQQTIVQLRPMLEADLLRQFGLARFEISVLSLSTLDEPGGQTPVTFLRVNLKEDVLDVGLGSIRDAIQRTLSTHNLSDLPVDVWGVQQKGTPTVFPISSKDPSVAVYESIRDTLAEFVFSTLGDRCESMCLFRVGRTEEVSSPTVVVLVKSKSQFDWHQLATDMNGLLPRSGPTIKVRFHIGYCGLLMASNHPNRPGESSVGEYAAQFATPGMGSSIGRKGDSGFGTLGGFATLRVGKEAHRGFMTCHHVIAPSNCNGEQYSKDAYLYSDAAQGKPEIDCPATEDLNNIKSELDAAITDTESRMQCIREIDEGRRVVGIEQLPERHDILMSLQETVNTIGCDRDDMEHIQTTLGRVLLSSGLADSERHILDWAFVELEGPAERYFKKNELSIRGMGKVHRALFRKGEDQQLAVSGLGEMEPDQVYLKYGRNTGVTAGVCNGTMGHVAHNTRADFIISKSGDRAFSDLGDSGALIINPEGKVCGILYGQFVDKANCIHVGIVTPINEVISSMAHKAGQHVTLDFGA